MSLYTNPHPQNSCFWYDAAEKFGAPNIKYCEETLCHIVSEPANTWSNLAYLFAALFIYMSAKKTKQKELIWLAPAMLLMGVGSYYYHMSNNYFSQILDFVGMYIFIFWLLTLSFSKAGWVKKSIRIPFYIFICTVCTVIIHPMYISGQKFQSLVVVGIIGILAGEFAAYRKRIAIRSYKHFSIGLIFIAIAQVFSQLDVNGIWCNPQNHIIQGHALWHVLNSIGLTIAYKHWEQDSY